MNEIEDAYKSADYCKQEIMLARKIFGDKNTTPEQYDAMQSSLSFMYLYCPEDLKKIVLATLQESERRKFYFESIWKKSA
jgi:hypothetical protein